MRSTVNDVFKRGYLCSVRLGTSVNIYYVWLKWVGCITCTYGAVVKSDREECMASILILLRCQICLLIKEERIVLIIKKITLFWNLTWTMSVPKLFGINFCHIKVVTFNMTSYPRQRVKQRCLFVPLSTDCISKVIWARHQASWWQQMKLR